MKTYNVEIDIEAGSIVSYSTSALDLLGYTANEVADLTVFDLVPEEELAVILEELGVMVADGKPKTGQGKAYDVSLLRKDGTRVQVHVNMEGVMDEDGEPDRVRCHFQGGWVTRVRVYSPEYGIH